MEFEDILLEKLISEGKITRESFDKMVEKKRESSPIPLLIEDNKVLTKNDEVLFENSEIAMMALADSYKMQIANDMSRQEENSISLIGMSEAYELVLMLMMRVELLENLLQEKSE